MKYFYLALSLFVLFAIHSGTSFAATIAPKKMILRNVTVTAKDCAGSLEKLRVKGLKEMKARRDSALAKARSLGTDTARQQAKTKAEVAYTAEMNVASKQLEAAKAICKKPTPKPTALRQKSAVPTGEKMSSPAVRKPANEMPQPIVAPVVSPDEIIVVPRQPATPVEVNVEISNFSFSPSKVTVKKGTTVNWTNNDGTSHTVTADTNLFRSDLLGTGQSFKFTFDKTGSFPYHCEPHRSMVASVDVTE